ncbi:hypothetical protein A2U01_0054045 [Trifolium medium]|uniref:Uncharacterized protein n=1 Tax=Trifolium medium TaxID=97028 RepID=A0A392R8C8_9FABA|nr:hypothetical protein [Trifolium medium]
MLESRLEVIVTAKIRSPRERFGFEGVWRRRLAAPWPNAKRRQYETLDGRVEREGKWVVRIGFQRRSEDIECNHDLDTHEAMANVLGSR